jgi:hypothetical protein
MRLMRIRSTYMLDRLEAVALFHDIFLSGGEDVGNGFVRSVQSLYHGRELA